MTTVPECLGCGHESQPDDRFCSDCGLSLVHIGGVHSGEGVAVDTVELTQLRPATGGTTSTGSWSRRLIAVVALLMVGLLTVTIFQPPTRTLDDVSTALTAVDSAVPTWWSSQPPDVPLVDLEDSMTEVADQPPTVAELADGELAPVRLADLVGLDDHHLIVSNSTHTVRLDPATDAVETFSTAALVIGHHRDQLILVAGNGELRLAPISGPDSDQRLLHDFGPGQPAALRIPGDGTVSGVVWQSEEAAEPVENAGVTIDLDSGEVTPGQSSDNPIHVWNGIDFDPGYGTFEIGTDGEPFRLSDGLVVAVGQQTVLIERCERPGECEQFWLDRRSGERDDRQVPPGHLWTFDRAIEVFGPDDRFLTLSDESGRVYFDTVTGRFMIASADRNGNIGFQFTPEAVSSDGRYLLAPIRDGVIVHDLQNETSGLIAVDIPGSSLKIELVPKLIGGG